jgi:hypothetical protein
MMANASDTSSAAAVPTLQAAPVYQEEDTGQDSDGWCIYEVFAEFHHCVTYQFV